MIPGLQEAVQRMDHAAFAHIYIIWAADNHQAPIPTTTNEAEIRESWVQILDILGIGSPDVFLKKLVTHWSWILKTLATNKEDPTAAKIKDLLSGKIGHDADPKDNKSGTLLRISPIYKKLCKLIGNISEETLTASLKKYINDTKNTQYFLICYLSREALFNYPQLPAATTLITLKAAVKQQLKTEFGTIQDDFCDRLTRLWLYGLYFTGAPITPDKLIQFLDHMITIPDLAEKTRKFTGTPE
jgi:hypothetical protein